MLGYVVSNSDPALKMLTVLLGRQGSCRKILPEYFCAEPGNNDYKASRSHHSFIAYCVLFLDAHNLFSEDQPTGHVHSVHTVIFPSRGQVGFQAFLGLPKLLVGFQHPCSKLNERL